MSQHSHNHPELYARIATATASEQTAAIREHISASVVDIYAALDADKESGAYADWKRRTGRLDSADLQHEMQDFGGDE